MPVIANVLGFVFLCLLVKYSSNDDDDFDEIHGLSIALLVILCVYLLLSSIFMYFHKKSSDIPIIVLAVIILLLWISRYILFVLLMHFIEGSDIERYSKKRRNTDIDKLKTCCHAFAIIQIIVDAIGQLDNLIPEKEQSDKNIYVYSH